MLAQKLIISIILTSIMMLVSINSYSAVAIDNNKLKSAPKEVTVKIQPTLPKKLSRQELFKSITVTTQPLKFTGQRPELFKSIIVTTQPLKFTGQRPELFKSIIVTTQPLKFTGQRPELFKSITVTAQPLKFTGQRPKK